MLKLKKLSLVCLAALGILPVCGFTLLTMNSRAQGPQTINDTIISIETSPWTIQPVAIVGFDRNHESLRPGVAFTSYDNWLQDLRVTVKNTSTAPVKYVAVRVIFPAKDEKGEFYLPAHQMHKGINYAAPNATGEDFLLNPGEETRIGFTDYNYARFAERASKAPAKALKRIQFRLIAVIFEDLQSGWFDGWYMKKNALGEWIKDESKISFNLDPNNLDPKPRPRIIPASHGRDPAPCYGNANINVGNQCKGQYCASDCTFIKTTYSQVAVGFPREEECVQCYNSAGQDCNIHCKMTSYKLNTQGACGP